MLIDSHCHIDFEKLQTNITKVMANAQNSGVEKMLSAGVTIKAFPNLYDIISNYDNVFCSVGTHPHYAGDEDEKKVTLEELIEFSKRPKVIAFGECGFDFYYNHSSKSEQEEILIKHINAAQETGLPIIIHTRDADEDAARVLIESYKNKEFKGVIHCFTSGYDFAMKMLDVGFYISASGIITFNTADEIRQTIKEVPLNRLLVETDSPYLAPIPHRGKTNEPSFVKLVAEKLAEIKGVSLEEISNITSQNFMRLFEKCQ
ncbi:MAG: TatD family hydrolase [Alphaproteobacteria bacterium]